METVKTDYKSIDEYNAAYPDDIRKMLERLRALVHDAVPGVKEKISWQMPTFYVDGIVIQFAAHKNHIGIYPGPDIIEAFKDRISAYKFTKGGFQLPYGKPVPEELLRDIIAARREEEQARIEKKKGAKKK